MKAIMLRAFRLWNAEGLKFALQVLILVLAYPLVQRMVLGFDGTSGYVDPGILVLMVLSMVCFAVLTVLCAWLFSRVLFLFNLPAAGRMVSQFNRLTLCQQFGFYLASFATLLFAAVLCLMAVL
ncbi:hypothetical protein ACXZ1K_02220 [Pedobacter sp. PWIIR3]